MANRPIPQPGIQELELYTPGNSGGRPASEIRKLSSNENLYGPSPKAIKAVQAASANMWRYPSVDHLELRAAIAKVNDLPVENIICGAGSDEILNLVAQAYCGVGDEVIVTQYGFEIYGIVARSAGATVVYVDETDRTVNVDNILKAVTDKTQIIYVANPSNPTGTFIDEGQIARLVKGLRSDIVLVLDGAYAEFVKGYDGGASFVAGRENVIMTRTFSKLYGLGGLRIGWGYASENMVGILNRIRGPFNLSGPALEGAKEAMLDQEYAQNCKDNILADRDYMTEALRQFGVEIDASSANFIVPRFASETQAKMVSQDLLDANIVVRSIAHYGLPHALRITIGTHEDCIKIVNIIQKSLGVNL